MTEKEFDDEWRRWLAENLILGGSRESILATLVKSGFPLDVSTTEIERASTSPYLTNNFMAQACGRKLVKLIPTCDLPYLYNDQHCFSPVDAAAIDLNRFPDFRHARVIDCEIGPGDLLFLPVGWWHYVKSLDISMTVSFTNFVFDNDFSSTYSTYDGV